MKGEEKKGAKKGKREEKKGAKKGEGGRKKEEKVYSVLHAAIFLLICSKLL